MLERAARWRASNPEKRRAGSARYRASLLAAAVGAVTADDVRAIFSQTNGACVYCGASATCLDHIIPLSRGGPHALKNLAPACGPCNFAELDYVARS